MTSCDFNVKTVAVGLPSVKFVSDTCLHFCEHVVKHLSVTLCSNCPMTQQKLTNQVTTIQWYLGMLARTLNEPTDNRSFELHCIYISKACVRRVVTLTILKYVEPKVLLEVIAQLFKNNLRLIKPLLPVLSNHLFDNCQEKVRDLIWDLSFLINNDAPKISKAQISNFDSMKIIVEVHDKQDKILYRF